MVHRVGLLVSEPETGVRPILRASTGEETRLSTPADAAPVRYLNGCVIEVDGRLIFGSLHVQDWRVLDAGDGSGNYVGVLRAYGARLVIDDRNSGSTIILDDLTAAPLRPYVGFAVLVIGHVTGNGYVVPVAFRVLAPHS